MKTNTEKAQAAFKAMQNAKGLLVALRKYEITFPTSCDVYVLREEAERLYFESMRDYAEAMLADCTNTPTTAKRKAIK